MEFITRSPQETERLGAALARYLLPGDVLAYTGDLGAGKTAFTRGLAAGLGITDRVTSPTYTVVNEYLNGRLPLFHFDMYRLHSADELFDIGWEDYLTRGGVCAVEWSENVEDALEDPIRVELRKVDDDPEQRVISIEGGQRFADLSI
ncbi:MAG TPA: tRNA (adenosine(37)-N6)-threonylcarbamoyltransferase complex ATPase subunit type 1 TsaE [Candidatus Avoscillospira avistercoris]|uniref:tRNA threonylcarbamoyladenosine biosynthesis protein TsaE n=1 Tax=Candidatus Avoscillospira avistercoris TaxID=2840707 RepID=A0A9D1JU11_9FIRM|nr:tRNA (adenosine(37)-N6)-threonylcarbamoyltransferase complex ATPase subunit type 1 TsaE [Candidatus Avoscillospira avistercoris]